MEYVPPLLLFIVLNDLQSIIAVHGLFGHHKISWTLTDSENGRETYRLRGWLPAVVLRARVLSFGYKSNHRT